MLAFLVLRRMKLPSHVPELSDPPHPEFLEPMSRRAMSVELLADAPGNGRA